MTTMDYLDSFALGFEITKLNVTTGFHGTISRLVEAAGKNYIELLNQVLDGALGEVTDEEVHNAITRASQYGNAQCVLNLLMYGAPADATDWDGDTCLILATCNNHMNVIKVLLEHGCDINETNDYGRNALHYAAWNGHVHLVQSLMSAHVNTASQDQYGDTALMLAALNGHFDVLKVLIETKCDVKVKNYDADTALHYAAKKGFLNCCELLVDAGAEVDTENQWDYTPLILAITENREDIVELLLEMGADVNQACTPKRGRSSLHHAVQRGNLQIVRLLLQYSCDVDIRDSSGNTPLISAVIQNHVEIVRLLLKANCDVKVIGRGVIQGQWVTCTLLDIAFEKGNYVLAQMLFLAGCDKVYLHPTVLDSLQDKVRNPALLKTLINRICCPDSLSEQCRYVIRESLGNCANKTAADLPLPKSVIKYIQLCDVDEICAQASS
ncbi:ankyrin repeat domain-containing protein 50-like isoform X1 [Lineus longissimus]|uniref:ankyrin repeat domain-containing protein 50-like isoform X1 n=1 Tax=Lineus longissimus TaxID=88925 RepID=UPI00315DCA47